MPMSSPMQNTVGSASISSHSPCRIASRYVVVAILDFLPLIHSQPGQVTLIKAESDQFIGCSPGSAGAEAQINKACSAQLKLCLDTNHLLIVSSAVCFFSARLLRYTVIVLFEMNCGFSFFQLSFALSELRLSVPGLDLVAAILTVHPFSRGMRFGHG